jgi:hypothetical protein
MSRDTTSRARNSAEISGFIHHFPICEHNRSGPGDGLRFRLLDNAFGRMPIVHKRSVRRGSDAGNVSVDDFSSCISRRRGICFVRHLLSLSPRIIPGCFRLCTVTDAMAASRYFFSYTSSIKHMALRSVPRSWPPTVLVSVLH